MDTKKLVVITLAAVLVLNLLDQQSKKGFEKSVLDVLKKNPDVISGVQPEQDAPPTAPPSEEEQIKKQLADRANVDIGNTPVFGKRDAKIKLIVFSDFQCPFSKRGADTANALIKKYGDKLMYVYKNLP